MLTPTELPLLLSPLAASALHITEEFAIPGGFSAWYRSYRPNLRFTRRFAIGINALLLAVCLAIPFVTPMPQRVALWLTVAALLAGNALLHVHGAIVTRRYSPGIVTALVLYVPLAVFGFVHFVTIGAASPGTAIAAVLLGGSYDWIVRIVRR